eukprot:CAMPEP_0113550426 /NCGR_PEP_ID=MMETSP0015_2-20120614/13974_1 /TAXON_ID=2838 /ORGANISM="Odontella" /LENGTH=182 /DNA_ID=CAMNT_0000451229 /DNA_START=176 /DNA_END=724 /DNA_ORIENTATION=+ /assembly_acc=CAM_ASM_000160
MIAFAASLVSVTRCSFLEARAELNGYDVGPKVGVGFDGFQLGGQGHCFEYPNGNDFGLYFRAPRAMSITAAALGGASLLILLVATLFPPPRVVMKTVGWALLLAAVLQGVSMEVVFLSDVCTTSEALELYGANYLNMAVSCALTRGSRLAIVAAVFWFQSSVLTFCLPEAGGDSTATYTSLR